MSPENLKYFLNQLWITGVAYGRRFPGETPGLSETDFMAIKDSLVAAIQAEFERRARG